MLEAKGCGTTTYITLSDIALLWTLEPELVTYANLSLLAQKLAHKQEVTLKFLAKQSGLKWQMSGIRMCEASESGVTPSDSLWVWVLKNKAINQSDDSDTSTTLYE